MWMYEVFKESMNTRVQAQGIMGVILVIFSTYYFEIVINDLVKT